MHRATIKDIADKSGFSVTTVSLVLNNKDSRISTATKERILKIAHELNYRPNRLAVSLVTKKTQTFGLIVPDISNWFFAELCKGCETEARRNNYNIIFGNSSDIVARDLEYIDVFIDKGVDGIISAKASTTNLEEEQVLYNRIEEAKIPIVTVDRVLETHNSKSVLIDNKLGGYMATNHLISYGHTMIGCITGPTDNSITKSRLAGYKQALQEAEIPFDPALIYKGNYRIASGSEALPYLLGKGVTAIFCFNDMMALGVYKEMRNYNLSIPGDISIVGFDDTFMAEVLEVPLTSVYQPSYDIGKEAVRQLIKILDNENDNRNCIVYEPVLNVRASTARIK